MSAVSNFAKGSSDVAGDASAVDLGLAEQQAAAIGGSWAPTNADLIAVNDPNSIEGKNEKALNAAALKALTDYMAVLGKLGSLDTTKIGSDVVSIKTSLASLKVTDGKASAAMDATSALANVVLHHMVERKIRSMILASGHYVDEITLYLAFEASNTAVVYSKSQEISESRWSGAIRTLNTTQKRVCERRGKCQVVPCSIDTACQALIRLDTRAMAEDFESLRAKYETARTAVAAFENIGTDHDLLVQNANHLTNKQIIAQLNLDASDLEKAAIALKGV